jgi:hypothetical protein
MGRDRAEQSMPDLFSTDRVGDDPAAPPKQDGAPTAAAAPPVPRYILPRDLPQAVKQLSDGELDQLLGVVLEEAKRRGRPLPSIAAGSTQSSRHPTDLLPRRSPSSEKTSKPRKLEAAEISLTRGQLNAVRAAFKAGITPSRIARQFGISQSDVRKALAGKGSEGAES